MKAILTLGFLTLPIFGQAVEFYCGDGSYSGAELCTTYETCDSHCSDMNNYTVWEDNTCNCWYEPGKAKLTTEREAENYYW